MPTEAADMAMPKAGPQTEAPAPQAQARNWLQLNTPLTHWQGRRVWLVGASTGIGLACAQALRAAGAQVVVSARNPQGVQDWAAQDTGVQWRALDVSDGPQVQATARALLAECPPDLVGYAAGY